MTFLKCFALPSTAILLAVVCGCAKSNVEPTMKASRNMPKPDMVIVNNFAVDPAEVKLDRGLMAKTMRDTEGKAPNEEEAQVGRLVAEKLAITLVEELREVGIAATRPGPTVKPTSTTVILNGEFLTVDQGNQTERVWVGFGMGGSELRTRIQAIQGGQLVAQADTSTKSSLKPGILTSAGASAAAGTGPALAVGAVRTRLIETIM